MTLSLSVYSLLIEIMGSSEDANVCSCDGQNHFLLSIEYLDGREVPTPFQLLQRADMDSS